MKVEVIKKYKDLNLGKILERGNRCEMPQERAKYLINIGYVKSIMETQISSKKTGKKKNDIKKN